MTPTTTVPVKILPAPVYFPEPLDLGNTIASWSSATGWTGRAVNHLRGNRRPHRGSRGGSR